MPIEQSALASWTASECRPGWHGEIQGVPGGASVLYDVATVGADRAWAVGAYYDGKGIVEHLVDGLWWWGTFPARPGHPTTTTVLRGVDAGGSAVWAVGSTSEADGTLVPLAIHRTSRGWRRGAVDAVGTRGALEDVHMTSRDTGWAVGWRSGARGPRPVAYRYGPDRVWVPADAGLDRVPGRLVAVAAAPDGRAWAVGRRITGHGPLAITAAWNGSRWRVRTRWGKASSLEDLVMSEPNDLWAVGWIASDEDARVPLAERWDGTTWQRVAANSPGRGSSAFHAVSISADTGMWAVGGFRWRGQPRPVVEAWDGRRFETYPTASDPDSPGTPVIATTNLLAAVPVGRQVHAVGRQDTILGTAVSCSLAAHPRAGILAAVGQGGTVPVLWVGATPARIVDAGSRGSLLRTIRLSSGDTALVRLWGAGSYRLATKRPSAMRVEIDVPVQVQPQIGSPDTTFEIRWARRRPPPGRVYDVQLSVQGGPYRNWIRGTTRTRSFFSYDPPDDSSRTTILFRARMRRAWGTARWPFSKPTAIQVVS